MKEEEVYRTIENKLEEIGVVNHPGIKNIIKGCFDFGMKPENVTIEVKDGNVVIDKHYQVEAINSDLPAAAASEKFATIQNNENNITLTTGTFCKENEVVNGKLTGRSGDYLGETVERKINEYGIEMDRTDKTYNFDGVVTTSLKLQRRGLQEVFYEYSRREGYRETGIGINEDYDKLESLLSFNRPRSLSQFTDCHPISYDDIQKVFYEYSRRDGFSETGIGSVDLDRLENLSFNRPDLSQFIDCHPISYEDIQKFSAHLTPKQQLFLSKLPNNGLLYRVLTVNGKSVDEYKAEKNKEKKDELSQMFVNSKDSKEETKTNGNQFHI